MISKEETNKALNKFGKYVVTQSKANLTRKNQRVSGGLYNSLSYDVNVSNNSFSMAFLMEEYGQFQDLGVKGARGGNVAPNSPFRFGTGTGKKGGLRSAILQWVQAKRIQFRDFETGKFMSYKSTAHLISRSIYNKGLYPTGFFSKPFEKGFESLPEELVNSFGLDVEKFLEFTINKQNANNKN